MKKIGVFGSINTDFVSTAKKLPKPGETVKGESFSWQFGGKGANKAVACSRLGLKTVLFGAVGDDEFSKRAVHNLNNEKVVTKHLLRIKNGMGGIANISTSNKTNMIVVVPGANALVDERYIGKVKNEILQCEIVAADLEVDQVAVLKLAKICKQNNIKFVLNASPIMKFNKNLLKLCDFIVVNELEIAHLPGYAGEQDTLKAYQGRLVLTKGSDGAYIFSEGKVKHFPAIKAKVVDTTGAGDAFLGGLIFKLAQHADLESCAEFANLCAGLKILKLGAQTGLPFLEEVLKKNNKK